MASVSFHVELDSSLDFAKRSLIKKEHTEFVEAWGSLVDQFGGAGVLFSGSTPAKLFLLGTPFDVDCTQADSPPHLGLARFFSSDIGVASGKPGNEVSFGVGSFDSEFYEELWDLFKKGGVKGAIAWSIVIWVSSIAGEESWTGFASLTRDGLEWSLEKDGQTNLLSPGDNSVSGPRDERQNNSEGDSEPELSLEEIIAQLEASDQAEFDITSSDKSIRRKKKKQ